LSEQRKLNEFKLKSVEWYNGRNVERYVLSHEEAFYLCQRGMLHVSSKDSTNLSIDQLWSIFRDTTELYTCQDFAVRMAVYSYYRQQEWIVRSGLLYGCDFGIQSNLSSTL
jgi:tRNA splicing endonuclease